MSDEKHGNKSVLIVDDVPKNIQVLGSFLARENLKIAYAINAEEALNLAFSNNFDLYLLDIMMPGMDGFQLCDRLKSDKRTADVPIIFLTAKTDPESLILGFELGAQDYVTKPFNASELIARVRTQLELREKTQELQKLNKTLEDKVKQRTAALENANQQLSRLEKAKSEFLSIMSHELRTPLNGINGLASLLAGTLLDNEQKKYLDHLSEVSKRLQRFSELATLVTTLRTRNQSIELFHVSLNILIEMAIDEVEFLIIENEITIAHETEGKHIQAYADADLIRKCISIMIEYAITNLASQSVIKIDIEENENLTILRMTYTGSPFTRDMLDEYAQFTETDSLIATENFSLTLAAIKLIMDAHSGKFKLYNTPKKDSAMELVFNKQFNNDN